MNTEQCNQQKTTTDIADYIEWERPLEEIKWAGSKGRQKKKGKEKWKKERDKQTNKQTNKKEAKKVKEWQK